MIVNQKIVILRHGEKPLFGLGQLTPQGFNRALALPQRLAQIFPGKPHHIYAPNPAAHILEFSPYSYVRGLLTIAPTAVYHQLPVNADYAYNATRDVAKRLLSPLHRTDLIFVCWEHMNGKEMAQNILELIGADPDVVPHWHEHDFDSLYVLDITWTPHPKATFEILKQGLDDGPKTYGAWPVIVSTT